VDLKAKMAAFGLAFSSWAAVIARCFPLVVFEEQLLDNPWKNGHNLGKICI